MAFAPDPTALRCHFCGASAHSSFDTVLFDKHHVRTEFDGRQLRGRLGFAACKRCRATTTSLTYDELYALALAQHIAKILTS